MTDIRRTDVPLLLRVEVWLLEKGLPMVLRVGAALLVFYQTDRSWSAVGIVVIGFIVYEIGLGWQEAARKDPLLR